MKKIFQLLLSVCMMGLVCCAPKNNPSVVKVSISKDMLQMKVGDIQMLEAKASDNSSIQWASSDPKVATVFEGIVEATGIGIATITASVEGGSASCNVYVLGKEDETLLLTPELVEIQKGKTYQFYYTSVYDVPLTWSSSNPEVASVDQNGLVTAHKAGTALITLSNGAEDVSARVVIPHTWGEYQLVWSEEFDGSSVDENVWTIEQGGGGWGNKEKQYYTNREKNVCVKDGNLIIQAYKEDYQTSQYTSARLKTAGKKSFLYGKIEARIMFPSGGGTWPAFWMLGETRKWPSCGEIDIIEHVGNNPRMLSFAVHTQEKNGTNGINWSSRAYYDGVEENYHVYGIEWREEDFNGRDRIIFTYDGIECATVMENELHIDEDYYWPFNQPHYIIINLALGGTMGGNIDDAIFDNDVVMKVDWVRVYQRREIDN